MNSDSKDNSLALRESGEVAPGQVTSIQANESDSPEVDHGLVVTDPTVMPKTRVPSGMVASALRFESFYGPLPHPELLAQYAQHPGVLEHILAAEKSVREHSQYMDRNDAAIASRQAEGAIEDARAGRKQAGRGQWISLAIYLGTIIMGALIAIYGPGTGATITGGLVSISGPVLMGIIRILVTGRHSDEEDDAPKARPDAIKSGASRGALPESSTSDASTSAATEPQQAPVSRPPRS